MMIRYSRSVCVAGCILAILVQPLPTEAQRIEGRLLEAGTGAPIALGELLITNLDGGLVTATLSEEDGGFALQLPDSGTYYLHGSHMASATVSVGPFRIARTQKATVDLRLQSNALTIGDSLVVSVPARVRRLVHSGFYDRKRRAGGTLLGPEEIRARAPLHPLDLFWGVPGLQVINRTGGDRAVRFWRSPCPPAIWVDGMARGDMESLTNLPVEEIQGLEIYRASEAPPRFGGIHGGCGVIVVWTGRPTG